MDIRDKKVVEAIKRLHAAGVLYRIDLAKPLSKREIIFLSKQTTPSVRTLKNHSKRLLS